MTIYTRGKPLLALLATLSMLFFAGCPPESLDDDDDDAGDDDAGDDDAGDDDAGDDDMGDDDMGDDDVGDDDSGDDDTEAPMEIPALSGVTCEDTEANDCVVDDTPSEWETCAQQCEGLISADGQADLISGTLDPIVTKTWDGDNDTFQMVLTADGYVNGVLDWDYAKGDLDWYFFCFYEDKNNPENWYIMIENTVDLTMPEQGTSVVPMTAGTECYAWVVGYLAPDGEPYTLHLWLTDP